MDTVVMSPDTGDYSCIIHPRAARGGRFAILNIIHVLRTWSLRYPEHFAYEQ